MSASKPLTSRSAPVAAIPPGDFDSLPKRLRFLKRRAGVKNDLEFAQLAGVGRSSISQYLSGKQHPRPNVLHRLAKATGVDVDWLFGNAPDDPAIAAAPQPVSPSHALSAELLDSPVNFYLLTLSIRTCKEFFEREGRAKPSLREVLSWISGPYSLHATIPDSDFRLVPPGESP